MSPRQLEHAIVIAVCVTGLLAVVFTVALQKLMEHC